MADLHRRSPPSFHRPLSHWAVATFVLSVVLFASAMALLAAPGVPAYMDPRPSAPPSPFGSVDWLAAHLVGLMAGAGLLALAATVVLVMVDLVRRERLPD